MTRSPSPEESHLVNTDSAASSTATRGSVVMGDQVAVSGGVVYGDVVMGSGAKSEDTDDE
ncbi:hypothetical protein ABZV25_15010, partial [Micrococcus luteus]